MAGTALNAAQLHTAFELFNEQSSQLEHSYRELQEKVALLTDGRFSGATRGMCIGYASPEAATGGPIGLIRDGDRIRIDAGAATIDVQLADSELAARRSPGEGQPLRKLGGTLEKYAAAVGPANLGAVTHSGAVEWESES